MVNLGGQLGVLRVGEMGLLTASSGNIKEFGQLTIQQVALSRVPATYHLALYTLPHLSPTTFSVVSNLC